MLVPRASVGRLSGRASAARMPIRHRNLSYQSNLRRTFFRILIHGWNGWLPLEYDFKRKPVSGSMEGYL